MKTFISISLCISIHLVGWTQNIIQAEYFIDTDKGFGNNTLLNVTPMTDGNFPFTVNLAGIAKGTHTLYLRTKDSDGKWSLTARKSIDILATVDKNKIPTGEYFFDTDPGFGAATAITISPKDSIILQNFAAIVSNLQPGYHKLFTRLQDDYGNWSLTSRHNVEVIRDTTGGLVKMVEYFFGTDPGFGNCACVTFASPSKDGTFSFTIPASQIPANYKNLYFRVKDSSNYNWSITQWKDSTTLPLTFLDFSAIKQNNTAQLNWKTTNEVNTAYFNVQRSKDAINFITAGKVTAKGAGSGNNNYDYADDISYVKEGKIFYRLEQADKDGKVTYSKIISIVTAENNQYVIAPNPAKDFFTVINNRNAATGNATLLVRDIAGHTVLQQRLMNASSQNINISKLAKGIYIVKIVASGTVQTKKLLVQ
ncbi:MAG: T9SS type A sorting domain-containing protein [Segetibacter sp.]